jgi:hypothetical protein
MDSAILVAVDCSDRESAKVLKHANFDALWVIIPASKIILGVGGFK